MANTEQELERTIFATIEEAIEIIRKGDMLIVVDDENRENEGDFLMAADKITPCLLYTSPSPRDRTRSRMPSSA